MAAKTQHQYERIAAVLEEVQEATARELTALLEDVPFSTVSTSLSLLKSGGYVSAVKMGRKTIWKFVKPIPKGTTLWKDYHHHSKIEKEKSSTPLISPPKKTAPSPSPSLLQGIKDAIEYTQRLEEENQQLRAEVLRLKAEASDLHRAMEHWAGLAKQGKTIHNGRRED